MRLVQVKPKVVIVVKKRRFLRASLCVLLLVSGVGVFNYLRPLPDAKITFDLPVLPNVSAPAVDWPELGEATFSAQGYDFVISNADPKPVSTASMAKVITALCVLEKRPLKLGETGPTLTMTAADTARLQQQYDQGGSHLAISEGEKLTQYQMLQAIMLPSANNIADSLAIWAFGSLDQYQKYAQDFVQRQGMPQTHIGPDASGFYPSTTSTTADLTTLGKLALRNPVIMQIAGTKSATFETAGEVFNVDTLLDDGILTGLKTGSNDGNTGGFIFTSKTKIAGQSINVVGAIVNAGSAANAVSESEKLAASIAHNFYAVKFTRAGQKIGIAKTAWGSSTAIESAKDTSIVRWSANKLWHVEQLIPTTGTKAGQIGTVSVRTNGSKDTSPIIITNPAAAPSKLWRLTHFR